MQDGEQEEGRTRKKRKLLSCFECRRRKLKCDRYYPACGRCVKSHYAEVCSYESVPEITQCEVGTQASISNNSTGDFIIQAGNGTGVPQEMNGPVADVSHQAFERIQAQASKIATLEARITRLETQEVERTEDQSMAPEAAEMFVENAHVHAINQDPGQECPQKDVERRERMFFKGCGFRSEFYGASNPWSFLTPWTPRVKFFIRDAHMRNVTFARLRDVLDGINSKAEAEEKAEALKEREESRLFELLPTKSKLDRLLKLHMDIYGNTYRVLHAPSFWKEYDEFWRDPAKGKPSFIVVVLLCSASVLSISPDEPQQMIGDNSTACAAATVWIDACDTWLSQQGQRSKHMVDFQIRCLMLLAKLANFYKLKSLWMQAGALLQFAVTAGLHREPTLLRGGMATAFQQEMRRRLWSVIVNLELEMSFDRGVRAMSKALHQDSKPPLSIDDEHINEDMDEKLPDSKADEEYTTSSFLRLSMKQLTFRSSMNELVNDPSVDLHYDQVLSYHRAIMSHIANIPKWSTESLAAQLWSPRALPRNLLIIQLQQYLMLLHYPFVQQQDFSKMICFEAASKIISLHSDSCNNGIFGLSIMRRDVLRAALCVCHTVSNHDPLQDSALFQNVKASSSKLIGDALVFFESKIIRSGHGLRSYWFILAVCCVSGMQSQQQTMDRVIRLYRRILSLQRDKPEGGILEDGDQEGNANSRNHRVDDKAAGEQPYPEFLTQDPEALLADVELPDWAFEEFWTFDFDGL